MEIPVAHVDVVKWIGADFEERFWFKLKVEGTPEPGVFDLGTEGRSFSSCFEMTVSQNRPVSFDLLPLGTIITIHGPAEGDAR